MYEEKGSILLKSGKRSKEISIPIKQRRMPFIKTLDADSFSLISTEYLKTASIA